MALDRHFSQAEVIGATELLEQRGRVLFAASCAERISGLGSLDLLPGTAQRFRSILNVLWRGSDETDEDLVRSLLDDAEQSSGVNGSFSEAYGIALICAIQASDKTEMAAGAAYQAYAAVDDLASRLLTNEGIEFSTHQSRDRVLLSELVQFELEQQSHDLSLLLGSPGSSQGSDLQARAQVASRRYVEELRRLDE